MTEETQTQPPHSPDHHARHHRERLWLIVGLLIIIGGLLALGILPRLTNNKLLAQQVTDAKSHVPEVVVATPKWTPDTGVMLPGNIEAIAETTINARTTGYLRKLHVDIGSKVKAGDVLAEIQAPDMDQQAYQAVAQTSQSRAVVTQSQADVDRQRTTVVQNEAEVAKQRAMVEQAQAQLTSSQAVASQSIAAEQGAEAQLEHMKLQLDVQHANLKTQQAQENLAKASYQRYKGLVEQGFDSQQDLDQAEATMKTYQAAVGSAQASIKAAEADIVSAQKAVQAAKETVKSAQANVLANQKNVAANEAALKSIQAAVQYAQQSVRVSQATVSANQATVNSNLANERRYAVMQKFQKVLAPFDGVITARGVDEGALIVGDSSNAGNVASTATVSNSSTTATGTGMLGIARTDIVRIQVSVPQSFVPALHTGANAKVTIRELPRREFSGIITRMAGALDSVSRTQLVEVQLPNKDGALVPGMYAQVQISPKVPLKTLRVPGTTLIVDANGTRVGVVSADNTVHLQKVLIGRDFGNEVEILKGLKGKEKLVNNPSDLLQDGDKVQIVQPANATKGTKGSTPGGDAAPTGKGGRDTASEGDTGTGGGKEAAAGTGGKPSAESDAANGKPAGKSGRHGSGSDAEK